MLEWIVLGAVVVAAILHDTKEDTSHSLDSKATNDLNRTRDIDNRRIEREKAARNGDKYYDY